MIYSIVGILAIFIHIIVNFDVFAHIGKEKRFVGEKFYLFFLLSVILYHVTDGFWGILYDYKLTYAVIVDTDLYFVAQAASILFWGLFITRYLGTKRSKIMTYVGVAIFGAQMIFVLINFFYPVLFIVTEDCVYSTAPARYIMLGIQVLMFLALTIFVFIASIKAEKRLKRRYIIIGLFSIFMIVSITLQALFPLMPIYSLGFLFGVTIIHTFVVEEEIETQKIQLDNALIKISIDALTGVMSKHAYVDREAEIDARIREGEMEDFAVVFFDLNSLKEVNDVYGHDAGDRYIIDSTKLIAEFFPNNPIYRVGGDEFVVVLVGDDYLNRRSLINKFNRKIDENIIKNSEIIISAGISDYNAKKDTSFNQVFNRADSEMYKRKHDLKDAVPKSEQA